MNAPTHVRPGTSGAKRRGRRPGKTTRALGHVQSLTRALALLERIAANEDGVTLTDIAQQVGLAPSTAHRLLATMEHSGFVSQNEELSKWYIGVKAFAVGNAFLIGRDIVAQARPFLQELVEATGETANLGVLESGEGVLVAQSESREMMRMVVPVGSRIPLHASGIGKALLAGLAEADVKTILHNRGLHRYTEHTIVTVAALREAFAEIHRTGYAVDYEEHAVGLRCVAATIYDEHSRPVAAISISGPRSRIPDARLPQLGNIVKQAAERLTRRLGGRT